MASFRPQTRILHGPVWKEIKELFGFASPEVVHAEDTGGRVARQMTLDLDTGRVTVRIKSEEAVLWQP